MGKVAIELIKVKVYYVGEEGKYQLSRERREIRKQADDFVDRGWE